MKHFYIHLHHNLVLHINFTLQTTENGCNLRTEKETAFSGHTFDPPVMGVFFFSWLFTKDHQVSVFS